MRIRRGFENGFGGAILCKRHDGPLQLCTISARSKLLLLSVSASHPATMLVHEHARSLLRNAGLVDCPRPDVSGHLGYVDVVQSNEINVPAQKFGN